MAFKSFSIILLLAPALTSGFVVPSSRCDNTHQHTALSATRRNFLSTSSIIATASISTLLLPQPALAKKEEPIIITQQMVTEAFEAIRLELTSPTGVVATLTNLINNETETSFEDIMQYTKESDAYFRRAKIGKARKMLTDKDLKGEALSMSNAVTFDLIGINRASRPGQRDKDEQLKYLGELKTDIERFLKLEGTIVIEAAEQ